MIVHYNTPVLTDATIRSIWKHTPDAKITVFDNSDKYPLREIDGVTVIDNTKEQVLDFDEMIASFPNRKESGTGYGSAKHCYTVDYCMDLFKDGFVLLDSDVLVKKDLSDLFDESVCWVGQPHLSVKHAVGIVRLYPFCCFINTDLCAENNIRYFDRNHMWELSDPPIGCWYDTGAWFLEATKYLPHREIPVSEYVEHYGRGSWSKGKISPEVWLRKYSVYYE